MGVRGYRAEEVWVRVNGGQVSIGARGENAEELRG